MSDATAGPDVGRGEDRGVAEVVEREGSRLRAFIRRRLADPRDAEDVLQEVFCELLEANRRLMPIEHLTAWLYAVARNRITDLFRKRAPESFSDIPVEPGSDRSGRANVEQSLDDLLPSPDAGPEAAYARTVLLDALEAALCELPVEQRQVFVAHEFEGRSFKEMSAASGLSVNTLLSRKRYAVLHLRERLREFRDDILGNRPDSAGT